MAADEIERGHELALRWYNGCHVVAPNQPGGDAGPAFASLMRARGRDELDLRRWLFEQHPPMPDMNLVGPYVDALVAYIRWLAK